jgi:hypothetical protein
MWRVLALTALSAALGVFVLTKELAVIPRYFGSVFLMPGMIGGLLGLEMSALSKKSFLAVGAFFLGIILLRISPWKKFFPIGIRPITREMCQARAHGSRPW